MFPTDGRMDGWMDGSGIFCCATRCTCLSGDIIYIYRPPRNRFPSSGRTVTRPRLELKLRNESFRVWAMTRGRKTPSPRRKQEKKRRWPVSVGCGQ